MKKLIYLFLIIYSFVIIVKAETIEQVGKIEADFWILDSVEDSDGNYYLTGTDGGKGILNIFDANYQKIDELVLNNYEECNSIDLDNNGNIYLSCRKTVVFTGNGITINFRGNTYYQSVIVKINPNLDIIYEKNYSSNYAITFNDEIKIYNNYLYVIGSNCKLKGLKEVIGDKTYYDYDYDYTLIKTDLNGQKMYEKNVNNTTASYSKWFYNTAPSSSGGTGSISKNSNVTFVDDSVYVGTTFNDGMLVAKFDTNGDKKWAKEYGLTKYNYIKDIELANNGNIIAVGRINSKDIEEIQYDFDTTGVPIILEFDPNGNIVNKKVFDGKGSFVSLERVDNGYYVSLSPFGTVLGIGNDNNYDDCLVKFDNDFNVKDVYVVDRILFDASSSKGVDVYDGGEFIIFNENEANYYTNEMLLRMDESKDITAVFNDLIDVSPTWIIDDKSIIRIENNSIVPLKVGTTTIRTVVNRADYVLKIEVLEVPEEVIEQPKDNDEPNSSESDNNSGNENDSEDEKNSEDTNETKDLDTENIVDKKDLIIVDNKEENPNTNNGIEIFGIMILLILSVIIGILLNKKVKEYSK